MFGTLFPHETGSPHAATRGNASTGRRTLRTNTLAMPRAGNFSCIGMHPLQTETITAGPMSHRWSARLKGGFVRKTHLLQHPTVRRHQTQHGTNADLARGLASLPQLVAHRRPAMLSKVISATGRFVWLRPSLCWRQRPSCHLHWRQRPPALMLACTCHFALLVIAPFRIF